ncbi:MAG: glycosyltransferase family 9 protein [Nanoarchaeota archaeon]
MQIIVIKLGAAGDVLRTLPLMRAIRDAHAGAEVTLITKEEIVELVKGIDYIHHIKTIPLRERLEADILYNFDTDAIALEIATHTPAKKKYGFYALDGYPAACNAGAEYYLNTIFDDELKKKNTLTYQEMMFAAAELPVTKEVYHLPIGDRAKEYAQRFVESRISGRGPLIGIHMGASSRWPSKVWSLSYVEEFIKKASAQGYEVILFGGPNEINEHGLLSKKLTSEGIPFARNNPSNSKQEFLALLEKCDAFICSDSFALHAAVGLQKKVLALFFCTSPNELESYGLVKKIVSPRLYEFFPEKSDVFDKGLVESISVEQVLTELKNLVPPKV